MNQELLLPLLVLTGALILFLLIFLRRHKSRQQVEAQSEYIAGLHALIAGDKTGALEKFRRTVRLDTDYIDGYLKIGDILRSEGDALKAIKIHRDLLIRPSLKKTQRLAILRSLAEDYIAVQEWKNAQVVLQQILDLAHKDEWALSKELAVYEEMGDWQGAYDITKKNGRLNKLEKKTQMAAYKYEQGVQLTHLKREHDARLRFRESIKENPSFTPAYLSLSDSYVRENRANDALVVLKKFIRSNSEKSFLAFSRLRQTLFELGHFGDLQTVFLELTRDHPEIVEGYLGLAEIYEKKGEFLRAVEACKQAIASDPSRIDHKMILIRLYNKLGRCDTAMELASELANNLLVAKHRYICSSCGAVADEYRARCHSCAKWNTLEISRD
ncbi:MAG TPA: tetratricopeptide repeat protein [bacterium]|jgi:lipopolysaccharide biosynthesis regulator YciM|nr:tetratricopeptide repeat protein [bacterium]